MKSFFRLAYAGIAALVTCIFMFKVVPSLGEKFAGLADLPRSTQFLLEWHRVLAFFPFIVSGLIYHLWPSRDHKGTAAFYACMLCCCVLLVWAWWASYFLPLSAI